MDARIEDRGDKKVLVIEIECEETPVLSSSKKSLVVASSHGNHKTSAMVQGKPLTIGLNAYIAA